MRFPPRTTLAALFLIAACSSSACGSEAARAGVDDGARAPDEGVAADPGPAQDVVPVHGYEIVATHPHDRSAYTQGLLFHDGHLFESTGRKGQSRLRRYVPETGRIVQEHPLTPDLFGEGLALWKDVLFQLTWQQEVAILYDWRSLQELDRRPIAGEMWGLACDGDHLILSDGSATLRFLDPTSFEVVRELDVTYHDARSGRAQPLVDLNELEVIEGEIWANVYQSELIARIDPETGAVRSWIDFTGLQARQGVRDPVQDVQNGIAWDPVGRRIFVTGKYWPNLYEIRVVEQR